MSKNLKHFDILGVNPVLYSFSSKTKKTLFGGIMSILSFFLCAGSIIYFFLEVFLRNSYSVIYNQSTDLNPLLNFTKIPLAFTIANTEGKIIDNFENQIRIYAEYANMYPDTVSSGLVVINRRLIRLEKCNVDDFGEFKFLYKNHSKIEKYFCLPINKLNFTLYGTFSDTQIPNSAINIRVTKCFNDPNKTDLFPYVNCFNRTEIDKNLANIFFTSINPEYDIDHTNPENPGKLILRTETLQLTSTIFNRYYFYAKVVNYFTDFGFFISDSVKQIYFQSDYITHMTDLRVNSDPYGTFGIITLTISKKTDNYWRNYVKLQTALANIGGIVDGIFFIFSVFVKFIMKNNYFQDLGIFTFGIDIRNQKDLKYKLMVNDSISSQVEINPTIKKTSEFKIAKKSIESNLKKINPCILNEQIYDKKLIKPYIKNDLMEPNYKILTLDKNISIKKEEFNGKIENGIFSIFFSNKKNKELINKKLEKIIRNDLSVENILKIVNHLEAIEKDMLDKNIIEKNFQLYLNEKLKDLLMNSNKDNLNKNKINYKLREK